MPEHVNVTVNTADIEEGAAEIEKLARERIAPAAALIDEAFATAAHSIQSNLARAAERGELSFKKLTGALLKDLRRFAINSLVRQPVHNLVSNALGNVFGGGRANGGFVTPRQSYLVGERGPELFTPSGAGNVRPLGASGMTVNISLPGVADVQSFKRSETQLAAALARAVGRGQRNL
ncbi:phage tail tape measure protein [Hyphococcus luteus]|nr:phage tail tape measure protein [Marinicaulis flavus]